MSMRKNKGYRVDFVNRVIIVTKDFHRRISENNTTDECKNFKSLVKELRDFDVSYAAPRKKKPARDHLTYDRMIAYICRQENSDELLREFNEIRNPREAMTCAPYYHVKEWFRARFPYYNRMTPFDKYGRIFSINATQVNATAE